MYSTTVNQASHDDSRSAIKLDGLGVATFLCGATASINLNIVGEVYLAELLLIVLALGILVFRNAADVIASHSLHMFVFFGVVMLAGYMITDIVTGTAPSQYLRGWGRVGLLVTNVVCLIMVAGQGRRYIWWFIFGMGVGGITKLVFSGVPIATWKLGYGEYVSFVILAMAVLLPRRIAILLLIGFGILNIALDYRNFAAVYLLVAAIIWARGTGRSLSTKNLKNYIAVASVVTLAIIVLITGFVLTEEEFGGRRENSNVGRWAGIIVSLRAIADSPVIGYGSWTENEEYAKMLREEQAKRLDRDRARRLQAHQTKLFRSHSQILQAWVEAGIFGAAFFLYYAFRLLQGAKRYIIDLPIDRYAPINLYLVILGTWHLIASPFGGDQRILIAITVAVLSAMEFDRHNRGAPESESPRNELSKNDLKIQTSERVLHRKK